MSGNTRMLFFALALGGFAIGIAEFAAMSLVPPIARTFGITDPEAGHAIVMYAVGVCVGAPTLAMLGTKLGRRPLLVSMMLFYAIGNGLTALAPNYPILLLSRFVSGLPHGAYFGISAVLAASLVPPNKRSQAVSRVILGLTVATIGGVPLANEIGQLAGWRWAFVLIAFLALLTALLIFILAPRDKPSAESSLLREFSALRKRQVWLTLAIGAIGFGSVFCVYTYLASIMVHVTHAPITYLPVMLAIFGFGMTAGTLVCGWLADHKMMPTLGGVLLVGATAMAGFPEAAHKIVPLGIMIFMIGASGGLAAVVQARLLTVAVGAETLTQALNQSAFNIANAVGPWLGGLAISGGFGWTSVGWVGLGLSLGGFLVYLLSVADDVWSRQKAG